MGCRSEGRCGWLGIGALLRSQDEKGKEERHRDRQSLRKERVEMDRQKVVKKGKEERRWQEDDCDC